MAGSPNPFLLRSTPAGSSDPAFVPPSMPAGPRSSPPPTRFGPFGTFRPLHAGSTSPTTAPSTPYSPSPASGTVVSSVPLLVWQSVQASSFDVKFGTSSTPPLVSAGQVGSSYLPSLTVNGVYYWQIIAYNSAGSTAGPVWLFYFAPPPADVVDGDPRVLFDPMPTSTKDISQIRTRVFVSGAGSALVNSYNAGVTAIEIKDNSMFSDSGGLAITGSQRFRYSGKTESIFAGALDGSSGSTSADPLSTMIVLDTSGQVISGRVKQPCLYKVSNVINGVETELSEASNTLAQYPFQTPAPSGATGGFTFLTGGSMLGGNSYTYAMSTLTADGEAFQSGSIRVGSIFLTAGKTAVQIDNLPLATEYGGGTSARATGRRLWRTSLKYFGAGGTPLFMLVATLDNSTSTFTDRASDDTLTTPAPTNSDGVQMEGINTTGSQVYVFAHQGPTGTTTRKIYRAPVNIFTNEVGDYTLIATIDDNLPDKVPTSGGVFCTFIDNVDTGFPLFVSKSGTATGPNVPPPTPPPLHYFLTGIPASGDGSLTLATKAGDNVNIFVQRDDLSAQIALAAIEGGDGIHEAPVINDATLASDATCNIRADAELALFSAPIQTVTSATRDFNVRSGSMINYNLVNPPIVATLMIQEVVMDMIQINNGLAPRFQITASSVKFSLNDFIRKAVL